MGSKKSNDGDKKSKKNNKGIAPPDQDSKGGSGMIADPRFASVHSDPRFQKVPRNKTKVEIDSRFKGVFKDKKFVGSSAPVDKRGRPKKKESEDFLKDFYQTEENRIKEEESEEEDESEKSESESGDELAESDSDTSSDDDEAVVHGLDDEPEAPEENIPEIEEETRRLAVVNLDWRHIKASDLYVILSSFLNENGQILSVAVYPSEFGLQRMAEEEVHGPVGLFDDKGENSSDEEDENDDGSDESSDDEDANANDGENENSSDYEDVNDDELDDEKSPMEEEEVHSPISLDEDESDEEAVKEIDNEKLREYEKSRMRYYYAVVECDSVATADHLYKACDGVEVARSSNMLDMRFIPDSMEFKHPPRDVATQAPSKYEGLNFQTKALQQSKIHLTWDEDEPDRAKTLKRKLNAEQLEDLELKEYLASEESESDEDEEEDVEKKDTDKKQKKRDLYKALLNSAGDNSDGEEDEEDDDAKNMEVTFSSGLEDQSKIYLEKDKKQETVWEAHLRARREKKRLRKNRSKGSSEDESSDDDREVHEESGDFFIDETMDQKKPKKSEGKSSKRAKREEDSDKEVEAATEAELELLLADDNVAGTAVKGYNLKPKKVKGKKGKKVKKTLDEDEIPPDVDDPRFSMLFTSPDFALDPTDPQFKRTATYARQAVLRKKKHSEEFDERPYLVPIESQVLEEEQGKAKDRDSKRKKHELSTEIRSVKMRCQQIKPRSNQEAEKSVASERGSKQDKSKTEKIRDKDLASILQSVKRHGLSKKKR